MIHFNSNNGLLLVKGIAHLEIMNTLKSCNSIWNATLFRNEVMGYVVEAFWREAMYADQMLEMFRYLFLMVTYLYAAKNVKSDLITASRKFFMR